MFLSGQPKQNLTETIQGTIAGKASKKPPNRKITTFPDFCREIGLVKKMTGSFYDLFNKNKQQIKLL